MVFAVYEGKCFLTEEMSRNGLRAVRGNRPTHADKAGQKGTDMDYIKVFEAETPERERLEQAAKMMTAKSPRGYRYYVGETYFDFGQDWKWTTILRTGSEWGDVQALYPVDQLNIIERDDLEAAVDEVFADKWCTDRRD